MTINGSTIKSPNFLSEYTEYIRSDNVSLDGSMQRNQINTKKVAELTWTDLLPSQLQALLTWADTGNSVLYSNSDSRYGTWSFTGLPTITDPGTYVIGGSFIT